MAANKKYNTEKKPGKAQAFFICVIIASFLWLFHSLNTVYTYTFKIPVEFKNIPPNKKALSELPKFLNVDVKASGLKLTLIQLNEPFSPLQIDFNELTSLNKNQNYVLSSSRLNFKSVLAFEAIIKNISPDTLYFTEKIGRQKNVQVKVPLQLKCEAGYSYNKPVITPSIVSIWGDTNLIKRIDIIYTQPLSLNNVNQNINRRLELVNPNANIHITQNEATVFIEVAQLIEQSVYVPVTAPKQSNKEQINIFPSKVQVKFTSLQNAYQAKDSLLFRATINSQKINSATNKYSVTISSLPEKVNIIGIEPKEVEVLILKNKW